MHDECVATWPHVEEDTGTRKRSEGFVYTLVLGTTLLRHCYLCSILYTPCIECMCVKSKSLKVKGRVHHKIKKFYFFEDVHDSQILHIHDQTVDRYSVLPCTTRVYTFQLDFL